MQTENKQYDIEFMADYIRYQNLQQALKNAKTKANALLWERFTKGIKNEIEGAFQYEERIENDLIELLKAIKSIN